MKSQKKLNVKRRLAKKQAFLSPLKRALGFLEVFLL